MNSAIIIGTGLIVVAFVWLIKHAEQLYDGDETLTEYQAQQKDV